MFLFHSSDVRFYRRNKLVLVKRISIYPTKKNISVVSIVTLGIKINQLSLTHLVTCHRILDGLRARMNCEIHQKIQRGKRKRYQKWIFDIKSHPFSYRVGCS